MESIISVKGLSKQYRIGSRVSYKTLRETLTNLIKAPARLFGGNRSGHDNTIWALKDVSFDLMEGEILGIIGRNGAGKTTLLKILSRITEPTAGEVRMHGRVASLLEVGTGFHQELTGRENIFLNGAILGMTRQEIKSKFDEIIDFAEIEKFLDTPVKRYSSGMYMRLAFAVAANLDPEILIVDEVLAIGDAEFQKKCLGKMGDTAKKGRTVLFVSHNMNAINNLCSKVLVLRDGRHTGPMETGDGVRLYTGDITSRKSVWINEPESVKNRLVIASVILMQEGVETDTIRMTAPFEICFHLSPAASRRACLLAIHILDSNGAIIYHSMDMYSNEIYTEPQTGETRILEIPPYGLAAGNYRLSYWLGHPEEGIWDHEDDVLTWNVEADCPIMMKFKASVWKGVVGPGLFRWRYEKISCRKDFSKGSA